MYVRISSIKLESKLYEGLKMQYNKSDYKIILKASTLAWMFHLIKTKIVRFQINAHAGMAQAKLGIYYLFLF